MPKQNLTGFLQYLPHLDYRDGFTGHCVGTLNIEQYSEAQRNRIVWLVVAEGSCVAGR